MGMNVIHSCLKFLNMRTKDIRPDLTLEYIRFQRSGMDIVDYCKSKNLPYLDFVDVVNKWNTRYGIPLVEKCMECYEVAGKWAEKNRYFPNPATIIREATLTFPSGVSLTMCDSTIKSLILTVVLYEEFDFGTDK